jgi:hypothetical protein
LNANRLCLLVVTLVALSLAGGAFAVDPLHDCSSGNPHGCPLNTPPQATPLVLLATTRPLYAGEVNVSLTENVGGIELMAKVTDRYRQPDPRTSVRVYGTGHFGSRGFTLASVSPGVWATMANLADIDELAVRVKQAGHSQLLYVGIPGHRLGSGCGGNCAGMRQCQPTEDGKCPMMGEGKCAKMGDCPGACKPTEDGKCAMMPDGKCAKMGDCKAKGANCPMKGGVCPMQKNCPLHQANQSGAVAGGCGGKCGCQGGQK